MLIFTIIYETSNNITFRVDKTKWEPCISKRYFSLLHCIVTHLLLSVTHIFLHDNQIYHHVFLFNNLMNCFSSPRYLIIPYTVIHPYSLKYLFIFNSLKSIRPLFIITPYITWCKAVIPPMLILLMSMSMLTLLSMLMITSPSASFMLSSKTISSGNLTRRMPGCVLVKKLARLDIPRYLICMLIFV